MYTGKYTDTINHHTNGLVEKKTAEIHADGCTTPEGEVELLLNRHCQPAVSAWACTAPSQIPVSMASPGAEGQRAKERTERTSPSVLPAC